MVRENSELKILAPAATGNGAYVVHAELQRSIPGYRVRPYSPWWTLLPPTLVAMSSSAVDLVHAPLDYSVFFKRPSIPLVSTIHNYVCDTQMKPYASSLQYVHYRTDLRWMTRMGLAVSSEITAVSQYLADKVIDDLKTNRPITVIYNGVDEARFRPASSRRSTPRSPLKILFCGNLNRRKRAQLLAPLANALGDGFEIHYTAGLSNSTLVCEGLNPGAAHLASLGRVEHADMPAIYQSMDILFMPSAREGFGLCVAEAMACGLPIVAANASAFPELVDSQEGGRLVPLDDVARYAAAIAELAESETLRRHMGEFNRARVEQRFRLSQMVDAYRQLFERTVSRY